MCPTAVVGWMLTVTADLRLILDCVDWNGTS